MSRELDMAIHGVAALFFVTCFVGLAIGVFGVREGSRRTMLLWLAIGAAASGLIAGGFVTP